MTLEPISTTALPGYFLNHVDQALALIEAVAAPNIRYQFVSTRFALPPRHYLSISYVEQDVYHAQKTHGDLTGTLQRALPWLGHVQISGLPGMLGWQYRFCSPMPNRQRGYVDRHEPDQEGEVNMQYLLQLLQSLGYEGYIGCEYKPRATTEAGLGWMKLYTQ